MSSIKRKALVQVIMYTKILFTLDVEKVTIKTLPMLVLELTIIVILKKLIKFRHRGWITLALVNI